MTTESIVFKSLYSYQKITTNYDWVYKGMVYRCTRCSKTHPAINVQTSWDVGPRYVRALPNC